MTHTNDHDNVAAHVNIAGRQVLDVGCGAGGLVRWLRERGAEPVGVECGDAMRALALEADPENALDYVNAVGQDLPFDDATFDVVTFIYSLHHVPENAMVDALTEAHRVLRPGGVAYIAEPVAAGLGHQVSRLIDDETEVRAHAQAAIDQADALGFDRAAQRSYTTLRTYADFEAYESMMVGIDPDRAAAMETHRDAVRDLFHEHGTAGDDGVSFESSVVFDVLTKR